MSSYFKSFNGVQSTQDEKVRFIKGNELKLSEVELFSFLFFKSVKKPHFPLFKTSTRLKNKIENNSTLGGAFYQGEWVIYQFRKLFLNVIKRRLILNGNMYICDERVRR